MSFTIDLNTLSDNKLIKLLRNVTRVISQRFGQSNKLPQKFSSCKQMEMDMDTDEKFEPSESLTSKLDRALTAPRERDDSDGDGDSLPYPIVTREQLDRELDDIVASNKRKDLSYQFGQMKL